MRGIRLYQDEIPATMPDGLGRTGSFQLLTAERIEVLRGPLSSLYGNASAKTAYAELAWMPPAAGWLSAAVEALHVDRIYVNDRNSDFAPAYTLVNARVGAEQRWGRLRFRAFARLDNLADRNYVGSVIVGDTNGRYFEPAPRRNHFFGATIDASL